MRFNERAALFLQTVVGLQVGLIMITNELIFTVKLWRLTDFTFSFCIKLCYSAKMVKLDDKRIVNTPY